MINLGSTQLWVRDQDEAVEFWTKKVGLELRSDVTLSELGDFRWVTVAPAGGSVDIVLMAIPGEPIMSAQDKGMVEELMSKGFAGTVFLTTDDCQASYEELKARGVEFTEAPEDRPYGIDAGFRDPSGNSARLTQVKEIAGLVTG
ncbi:MAG TPA: VOC family protein [Solirubrobacterales bacterium]|nr:VOC family protein [Solirubrobacterales bacterium]